MTIVEGIPETDRMTCKGVTPLTLEQEYEKCKNVKKEDIEAIKEWAKTQTHFTEMQERLLILFNYSCFYNMERTKSCIQVFHNIRNNTPEFFDDRDVSLPYLKKSLETLQYGVLPVKDPKGYQIIFHRLKQYEPSKYVFADGVKLLVMAAEACLYIEGTAPGFIFLFDMKGVRLTHLTRLNLSLLRKFFTYIQEGIPIRLKAIHVVNTLPIIDKVMFMIKPFMKKELLELIHFHSDNYEEVQQFIPKSCLPSDFGGDLQSCDELHADYAEWMKNLSDYFKEDERIRHKIDLGEPNKANMSRKKAFEHVEID